jgi:hypothetical protein
MGNYLIVLFDCILMRQLDLTMYLVTSRSEDGGGGNVSNSSRASLRFQVPTSSSRKSSTAWSPEKDSAALHQTHHPHSQVREKKRWRTKKILIATWFLLQHDPGAPPRRNAESGKGIDSVIYSPAATASSSARGTPCSEMFFGSGNTTPSYVTSPPPMMSAFRWGQITIFCWRTLY